MDAAKVMAEMCPEGWATVGGETESRPATEMWTVLGHSSDAALGLTGQTELRWGSRLTVSARVRFWPRRVSPTAAMVSDSGSVAMGTGSRPALAAGPGRPPEMWPAPA